MSKFNPFGAPKKLEFEPVGTEETGKIYLLKRDRLKVKENPMDLQQADRKQAETIALIGQATKRLAEAKNIPEADASEMFFPKRVGDTEVMPKESLMDWLDLTEKTKFLEINSSASSKYKVATLFIKHRLGYHVAIAESAKAKAGDLEVEPLRWAIPSGSILQFDGFRVEVIEAAEIGDERLYIKPLPQKLDYGAAGFLIDFETNSVKVGLPSWTDDDTKELDEIQVDAIFEFYQSQIGLRKSDSEGKSLPPTSESSSNPSRSTGGKSTAESNGTESQTPNSVSKDLEIVTAS